jgi:hypothetical protein
MALASKPLTATGLVMAPDFPTVEYEAAYERVRNVHAGNPAFRHFGGAFNAMSYRFREAHDVAVAFQEQFKREGASPPPEPRYEQERLLFDFYSSCFSVLEAYFFALFAVGHMLKPGQFPLSTAKDEQKVGPSRTVELFEKHFTTDPMVAALKSLTQHGSYKSLREARNVLTHRSAPGRLMYVSTDPDEAPPTEWKLDSSPLTHDLLLSRKGELASLLRQAMVALAKFTKTHIK